MGIFDTYSEDEERELEEAKLYEDRYQSEIIERDNEIKTRSMLERAQSFLNDYKEAFVVWVGGVAQGVTHDKEQAQNEARYWAHHLDRDLVKIKRITRSNVPSTKL